MHNGRTRYTQILLSLLLLITAAWSLSACGISPWGTPNDIQKTEQPAITSTAAPTAAASPTALPSATAAPSLTATQALTATPTRTIPLAKVHLLKGPDVLYTGSNSEMKIFWQWSSTADFRLDWGADRTYSDGSVQVTPFDSHNNLYAHTIQGLTPGTRYEYRVVLGGQFSAGSFWTAPEDSAQALKFISYGDTRAHPELHEAIAAQVVALYESDPAYQTFNLHTGDLVTNGTREKDWTEEFFSPSLTHIRAELANMAVLPVIGNHERSSELFSRYFPMPFVDDRYWSFDYGPAHFVLLDQYAPLPLKAGSPQYQWLEKDLAGSNKTWKIVVLHEPGWSAGGGHEPNAVVQNDLQPLFEKYGVAMVIAGHNHYYARAEVRGVQHVTIGTGGAPVYEPLDGQPNTITYWQGTGYAKFEIDGSRLSGWFIDNQNQVRDLFNMTK